ncbi:MAG TPA: nucleotidyltransferase family protein [Allosphingosinicella sp.]
MPPEFTLVAACCRWPPSPARDAAVREAAAAGVDWGHVDAVAARHRVEGLVHDGLLRAGVKPPEAVAAKLAALAPAIARQNLMQAAESARLDRLFADSGIGHIFLKGLTLNVLAYGTLGVKKSSDIDIAIAPEGYEAAIRLIRQAGYACEDPGPEASMDEIMASTRRTKHSGWVKGHLFIELHLSFVDSPRTLRTLSVAAPRQRVQIAPSIALDTLAKDELFAYLCVHGSTHAWSRIKWLADLNALLKDEDGAEIERLYRRSLELGAGRATAQGLLLCADLLGLALPKALERELRRDRWTRFMCRVAMRAMLHGDASTELNEAVLGTVRIHFAHLVMQRGLAYKVSELRRKFGLDEGNAVSAALLAGPRWLARRARTRKAVRKAVRKAR